MRLFIAVDVDSIGIEKIKTLQECLRKERVDVRLTKPETWHVTLKFLGETEEKKLAQIKVACDEIADKFTPFPLEISGVSAFPNPKMPRVLFVNLNASAGLSELVKEIENGVERLGFQKENRPFHSHVTIARIKDTMAFLKTAKEFMAVFSSEGEKIHHKFIATEFHLYESRLTKSGPEYMRLYSFKFCSRLH